MDAHEQLEAEIARWVADGYRIEERTSSTAVLIRVNWRWRSLSGLVGLLLGLLGGIPTKQSRIDFWIDEGEELRARYS